MLVREYAGVCVCVCVCVIDVVPAMQFIAPHELASRTFAERDIFSRPSFKDRIEYARTRKNTK